MISFRQFILESDFKAPRDIPKEPPMFEMGDLVTITFSDPETDGRIFRVAKVKIQKTGGQDAIWVYDISGFKSGGIGEWSKTYLQLFKKAGELDNNDIESINQSLDI